MTTARVVHAGSCARCRRAAAPELDGAVALEPEPELTLCPVESEPVRRLGLSAQEHVAYSDVIERDAESRHRMLGHPDVVQGDPRTHQHELLLLQLDLAEDTVLEHGEGRIYWFVAASDVAQGKRDRARSLFQQT
jgi:hypothetical protein